MTTHQLKVHPKNWQPLKRGQKPFEVRRNDRNFRVGDLCAFSEYDPDFGFTGSGTLGLPITYILYPEDFVPGAIAPGYVVLGFGTLLNFDDGK